ncbi:MAG: hypothetical protein R2568_04855 [Candidatus Scalindua sp.]|nr:hypothetical protein [Candidatus Scalindua sp.]
MDKKKQAAREGRFQTNLLRKERGLIDIHSFSYSSTLEQPAGLVFVKHSKS